MQLEKITDQVFYISGRVNIGVIRLGEREVVLIDSGLDDSSAWQIIKILQKQDWQPTAVINTHAHADHCGGNVSLKNEFDLDVYAPELEEAIVRYPYLEPLYLFSGADPISDLQSKFLRCKPSAVDYVIKQEKLEVKGVNLEIVDLAGHAPNQIGVAVDGVLFCADAVLAEETVNKYTIPYCTDIGKHRQTLSLLKESSYDFYLPSHGELKQDINQLVTVNQEAVDKIETQVVLDLETSCTTEEILKTVCDDFGVEIKGSQQYHLMKTTIMAYLSYLYKQEKINLNIEDNKLYWKKVS